MRLRKYEKKDCQKLAVLFYETVHTINTRDYTREQVERRGVYLTNYVMEKENVRGEKNGNREEQ